MAGRASRTRSPTATSRSWLRRATTPSKATPGNDALFPGPGDDEVLGGSGTDAVAFVDAVLPVTVDLASGYANENGDHDTISDVENVLGSEYGDHIYGDDGPNVLDGWEGDDHI